MASSSLSSELSDPYDSDEGSVSGYTAKPTERTSRRSRTNQTFEDEDEEDVDIDWENNESRPAPTSRSTRGRVVDSSGSQSGDEIDEAEGYDEQLEEDFEDYSPAPPPPKRSIKLVVANPKKAATPVSPAKKSSSRSSRAAARYDDLDDEDDEDGNEDDGLMLDDEDEPNTNEFEDEEDEEFDDEFEDGLKLPGGGTDSQDYSRMSTPDFSKMTARQRARFDGDDGPLLELPAEPIKKKIHLTEEEQQLKRAEMARRRKNMSVRRLEEEKQDTLDKLLKKRASRSRKIITDTNDGGPGTPGGGGPGTPNVIMGEDGKYKIAKSRLVPKHPSLLAWQSTRAGFSLSMESEWLEIPKTSVNSWR